MDEKLRILLCEDDENLGMLLREYLQRKMVSHWLRKYVLQMPKFLSSS